MPDGPPTMKVTKVTPRLIEREMGGNLWNPRTRWTKKRMVLVFIETDTGLFGVGEGWTTGGSARALVDTIEDDLAPLLLGQDPHFVTRLGKQALDTTDLSNRSGIVAAALGAVDTALWDLIGKAAKLPLYKLLGAYDEQVFTYASAGLYGDGKSPDDLGAELRGYVEQGFTAVKMKVGGAPLKEDVARVAAAREAIGPDTKLMVDALYNLSVPEALAFARAIERYDIHFFEAPVSVHDVKGQAEVHARSPIPVCGNETLAWTDSFRELITAGAVHYVQFDPAVCGGITEGRRIADLAHAFHLPCTLHASSTSVVFAACLHLGAALANCVSVEYHMLHQWFWDLEPEDTFIVRDGFVRPPHGPGLGLAISPDDLG
jgi:L-alanine-DL-glutamate epimerase-like enolase superfamily enzyme